MKEITIIWQFNRSVAWEGSWIEYLFQNIPHTTVDDWNHTKFIDNSIIVDTMGWGLQPKHIEYMKKMFHLKYSFSLVHLSDEERNSSLETYSLCKSVFRNYYRDGMPENTMSIPLGWNTGFTDVSDNPSISERTIDWAFIGQRWDSRRQEMANVMQNVPNGVLYVGELSGPRLSAVEMSKIYRKSIFVICPHGSVIADNFRVTEAFEAGCIPIVQRDTYYLSMHGIDFPAIQVDNWSDIPSIIQNLMKNKEKLEEIRVKVHRWWETRKSKLVNEVTNRITSTMG